MRLDLFADRQADSSPKPERRAAAPTSSPAARSASGSVRLPEWVVPAVETDQQWETAVITVVDDPPTIALFTSPHRLRLYSQSGKKIGQGPDLTGVGRILRTAPGWLAAATDRQILLCDLKRHTERRLDVSLVQLTHLAIKPDEFGLALIQERDRIGRLSVASRWIWKQELRSPVEDLALGPMGFAAVTTNSGELMIFDPAGKSTVGFNFDPTDPPLLIEAPAGSPAGVIWLSLARRGQWLRGHDQLGEVLWDRPIPWEGWSMTRAGKIAILTAADGRALTCDGGGTFLTQSAPSGDSNDVFSVDPSGEPIRISRRGVHIISASLDGRVRWRCRCRQALGPAGCRHLRSRHHAGQVARLVFPRSTRSGDETRT